MGRRGVRNDVTSPEPSESAQRCAPDWRRTIAIPPHVVPVVERHLQRFVGPAGDDLVFKGEKGGPLRPHVLQKAWDQAKATTGLSHLHLHDLRHAGNTWAAATGASTKELMARMGHANATAALRYQHATLDRDQAIARALSDLVTFADVVPIARKAGVKADGARDGRAMRVSGQKEGAPPRGS